MAENTQITDTDVDPDAESQGTQEQSQTVVQPQHAAAPAADTVTLSREAFEGLMDRLGKLEDSQSLLLQVQDKNKIQRIEELRRSGKLVKSIKLRKYNSKLITGWKMLQDEVFKDENGRIVEKQIIKVFFDDESDIEMPLRQWAAIGEYVAFDVTGESKNADGDLFFKIVDSTGRVLEINASFVN